MAGRDGGFAARVRADQERRAAPLETEAEWLLRNASGNASAEAGPVGPQGLEGPEGGWEPGDDWVDIRTANFSELYTAEFGPDWLREFPDSPAGYRSGPHTHICPPGRAAGYRSPHPHAHTHMPPARLSAHVPPTVQP